MHANPLVSVIIPAYRAESVILRCIKSVIQQTYKNIEILIVDDGSPDRTGELADQMARDDERVKVWHKTNGGVSSARNLALDNAKGEYISFVDSDDWLEPEMIKTLVDAAELYEATICISSGYYRDFSDRCLENGRMPKDVEVFTKEEARKRLVTGNGINDLLWTKLWHRSLFLNIRFIEGHTAEDHRIHWRLFENANKVIVVPCRYYHYTQNENSIMHSYDLNTVTDRWIARKESFDTFGKIDNDYRKATMEGCAVAIGRTWSWIYKSSKAERSQCRNELNDMNIFAKKYFREILGGGYSLRIKCGIFFALFKNEISYFGAYMINQIYRKLRGDKLNAI